MILDHDLSCFEDEDNADGHYTFTCEHGSNNIMTKFSDGTRAVPAEVVDEIRQCMTKGDTWEHRSTQYQKLFVGLQARGSTDMCVS
jgi:hypothetical protein